MVLCGHILYVVFSLTTKFRLCARGRQWSGIWHFHWWTASIKPRLLFSPWKLCFLRTSSILRIIRWRFTPYLCYHGSRSTRPTASCWPRATWLSTSTSSWKVRVIYVIMKGTCNYVIMNGTCIKMPVWPFIHPLDWWRLMNYFLNANKLMKLIMLT